MKPKFDTITGGQGATPKGGKQDSGAVRNARVNENVAGKLDSTSGMPSKRGGKNYSTY